MANFSLNDLPSEYQSLKDASILIIGNGPSASVDEMGKDIEKFDQIIRINNFVTDKMESRVGSRTDIWVNGANQGLKRRPVIPEKILVMIPTVVLNHKGEAIHPRIEKRLGTQNYFLLPLKIMSEMESICGLDRPTTGFFAIYFFYLLGLDVTLHGFDFFVGSTAHYFDGPLMRWLKDRGLIKKAGKHDVSGEKEFVEALIHKGHVKVLGT
jgi:hypothetical protein